MGAASVRCVVGQWEVLIMKLFVLKQNMHNLDMCCAYEIRFWYVVWENRKNGLCKSCVMWIVASQLSGYISGCNMNENLKTWWFSGKFWSYKECLISMISKQIGQMEPLFERAIVILIFPNKVTLNLKICVSRLYFQWVEKECSWPKLRQSSGF